MSADRYEPHHDRDAADIEDLSQGDLLLLRTVPPPIDEAECGVLDENVIAALAEDARLEPLEELRAAVHLARCSRCRCAVEEVRGALLSPELPAATNTPEAGPWSRFIERAKPVVETFIAHLTANELAADLCSSGDEAQLWRMVDQLGDGLDLPLGRDFDAQIAQLGSLVNMLVVGRGPIDRVAVETAPLDGGDEIPRPEVLPDTEMSRSIRLGAASELIGRRLLVKLRVDEERWIIPLEFAERAHG